MNTTYEILPDNQVKIIDEVMTTKERVVDLGAVRKRIVEINDQISSLEKERTSFRALVDAVEVKKSNAKVPENIKSISSVVNNIE